MYDTQYRSLNYEELSSLSILLCADLDNILLHFDIDGLQRTPAKLFGACPIHQGHPDNPPFCIRLSDSGECSWKCYSHNCHLIFKGSILGLVRGMLSRNIYEWNKPGDKLASFGQAKNWALKWLKKDPETLRIDQDTLDKLRFIRLNKNKLIQKVPDLRITREMVRERLCFPAKQLVEKGFDAALLDQYDIGLSINDDPNSEMFRRIVVPIYDETHSFMLGFSGRSIYEKCQQCKLHHSAQEPCPKQNVYRYVKWKHSKSLKVEESLFNYWAAKPYIKQYSTAIITESIGNVLRAKMAGINCAVGTFGTHLTESQQLLLSKLGVLNIIIVADNDEPGRISAKLIKDKFSRIYNITIVDQLPDNRADMGEMTPTEIQNLLTPILRKYGVQE